MKIKEIAKILNATIHYEPEDNELDIFWAGASDLMSDVLAYMSGMPTHVPQGMVLITGLINLQVLRTVNLMDISMVVFTRGKTPTERIIEEAKSIKISILSTALTSYSACGLLYAGGIRGLEQEKHPM
jgi:hypothetical protein